MFDQLLAMLAPHHCLLCRSAGYLLCPACAGRLAPAPGNCYRCAAPADTALVCPSCRLHTPLQQVVAACAYQGPARELVARLKFGRARAAAGDMATSLAADERLRSWIQPGVLLVPVPTDSRRVRQRGYDQAVLLTRVLGRRLGLPVGQLLSRTGRYQQRGMGRAGRMRQAATAYEVHLPDQCAGRSIVLVDDVLTTGATLEAAARAVCRAGAARVYGAVFARA